MVEHATSLSECRIQACFSTVEPGNRVPASINKVLPGAFLEHVDVSSAELTDLKPKGFGKFSVNPASSGLFWRFGAGCAIAHKAKEKPLELCAIPTV